MKKISLAILFLAVLLLPFFVISSALAQNEVYDQLGAAAGSKGAGYGYPLDPRIIAAYVVQIVTGTVGIVFLAYTVYAGFLILTSGGNEEKTSKGRRIIFHSILGVLICLSAFAISLFVGRYFLAATTGVQPVFYDATGAPIEQNTGQFYPLPQPDSGFNPFF